MGVATLGYNRSYRARRLRISPHRKVKRRKGKRKYTTEDRQALRFMWELMSRPCGKRLKAIMPFVIDNLERYGKFPYSGEVRVHLLQMGSATMDRLLRRYKRYLGLKRRSTTKPGSLSRNRVPVLRYNEWSQERPGFLELDLVAHCGETTRGEYINTLSGVDTYSGWVVMQGVMGKSREHTLEGLEEEVVRLPFFLLGIHSDNGSEFINDHMINYCRNNRVNFSKGRSYRKKDNPRVEERNYTVVRRFVGYDRYDTERERVVMNELYPLLEVYYNYFQPMMKLERKERVGGKVRKVYSEPKTPYMRLQESSEVSGRVKRGLREVYLGTDLLELKEKIDRLVVRLFRVNRLKKR